MIDEKTLLPNLEDTRRDLIALRVKRGADSAVGHRCSNVIELIQNHRDCEPGTEKLRLRNLVGQQMDGLQRAMRDVQEPLWRCGMAVVKYTCEECGWNGTEGQVLRAPNPFADDTETMIGCPDCREPNSMRRSCEHKDCWQAAGCGTKHSGGYAWTCYKHRPQEAEPLSNGDRQ